jgi:predicted nucleotidyltransferase
VVKSIKGYLESGSTREFDDPRLEKLIRLLKRYEPEQIILFGSRARGDADEYSDYDRDSSFRPGSISEIA